MKGNKFEQPIEEELKEKTLLPKGWALLTHGSNLGRRQWTEESLQALDEDVLVIKHGGLSVIGEAERQAAARRAEGLKEQGITLLGEYNTTKTYSSGTGETLTIHVVFPAFGEMYPKFYEEQKQSWIDKYGPERADEIAKLVNGVHHQNNSRHSQFSRGTRLIKIKDEMKTTGREITYVPEALKDVYDLETADES